MESEIKKLIMVWGLIYVSVNYCYIVAKIISKGTTRLITFLPVVCLFLVLPRSLNSVHFGGATHFFITFLGTFKLLLLAYGMGPLSDPSLSLGHFVSLACLPIMIQQNPPPLEKPLTSTQHNESLEKPLTSKRGLGSPLNYSTKALVWALLVHGYDYREYLHPRVVKFQLCVHLYITIEMVLAMAAALAQALLGLKLEPQFDNPILSTSLQDFWGRRWNLVCTSILRLAVYNPVFLLSKPILGHKWAFIPALMATFLVSGLMHELVYSNAGHSTPTWKVAQFFLIHGLCLTVEIVLKKKFSGMFRLPPVISGLLTLAFVIHTFARMGLPQLLLSGGLEQTLEELSILGSFVKHLAQSFTLSLSI
ncbi:hypothetical protein F0562_014434 [Nyssa sinensis]|uniref:Wax synthase domain-containing protein n=1 Tax=Nyssa sinensis TaxID=561372 RepID=A0A5J4ZR42_9ASTE|nr:hypothetical protein F0562_014434 [Nyssa sinensis]